MRIVIIKDPLAGGSTLAAHIARALVKARKEQAQPLAILTSPSTAYRPYSDIEVARVATLNKMLSLIHGAQGPTILDDMSEFYGLLLQSWRSQTGAERERRGLSPKVRLSPDEWQVVNSKFARVREAATRSRDCVEIYRRSGVYVNDADLGLVEGEGDSTRGNQQAGAGADIVIRLGGGLKDRNLQPGWRVLKVLSDTSQRVVGRELSLPRINSREDRLKLDRELAALFRKPLEELIAWGDEEREAWDLVHEQDPPDSWPEAREQGERAEAAVIASELKALMEIQGLGGQTKEVKQARAAILYDAFKVGDVDALTEVPADILRTKLPWARRAIQDWRMP